MTKKTGNQALRREWNQILRAEGLDEIETSSGRMISTLPASQYVERALTDGREGYYEMARHFARQGRLRGRIAEAWKLHAEGVGYRRIAAHLNCSKRSVEDYINAGRVRMAAFFSSAGDKGDKARDKGDKATGGRNKRKAVAAMVSDLEGALWQTCNHGPFLKSTTTIQATKTRSSSSLTESLKRICG